jgi:hypothetical protein
MLDSGPCLTCQHATGIMVTSIGLYRVCTPEEWQDCDALYRSGRLVSETSRVRRKRRGLRKFLRKTRAVAHLLRRSFAL